MSNTALKAARCGKLLTQRQLAESAGIKYPRFLLIEQGHKTATPHERDALGRILQLRVSKLFPSFEVAS